MELIPIPFTANQTAYGIGFLFLTDSFSNSNSFSISNNLPTKQPLRFICNVHKTALAVGLTAKNGYKTAINCQNLVKSKTGNVNQNKKVPHDPSQGLRPLDHAGGCRPRTPAIRNQIERTQTSVHSAPSVLVRYSLGCFWSHKLILLHLNHIGNPISSSYELLFDENDKSVISGLSNGVARSSTAGKNQPIADQSNPVLLFLRLSQRLKRHITEPSLSSAFRPWKWLLVPHRFRHQTPKDLSDGGRTVTLPVQHSLDFKQSFSLWVLTRAVMGEIRRANLELFRRFTLKLRKLAVIK
ncbi:hypothetical protein LXL04_005927 [Taraxacum kok-saghyz]